MPETEKSYEHTCPECGGDTARTRDRYPFTTHGSRAYLWLLFVTLCAGYIVALMLASNIGTHVTDHAALANTNAPTQPVQYTGTVDEKSIFFSEMQMVLGGKHESIQRIRNQLRDAIAGKNEYGMVQDVSRVRLEVHHLETYNYSTSNYAVFGQHVSRTRILEMGNPRTRAPAQPKAAGHGITYTRWWPGFHIQISDPGSAQRTYSLSYLTILGYLCILFFLSWAASRLVPRRWHRHRVMWLVLCVSFMISVICGITLADHRAYGMTKIYPPIATGPFVDAERVRETLADDDNLRELLKEMGAGFVVPRSTPAAVVVGREYRVPTPDPTLPKPVVTRWNGWWLLKQGGIDLLSVRRTQLDAQRTTEQRRAAPHTPFWNHLYHWGRVRFEWHRAQSTIAFDFNLPNIALILTIPWWIWIVLSRTHRFRTWRIQRKRVNRGQCIYCGYRAADEALAARWEDAPEDGRSHNRVTDNPD